MIILYPKDSTLQYANFEDKIININFKDEIILREENIRI